MQYRSVRGFTGFGQLGTLFVFWGLGFILAAGVQLIIGLQMIPPGTAFKDMGNAMLEAMTRPENVGYTRMLQVLGTFCLLFIPAILYSWITNGRNKFWLGFNPYVSVYQLLIGFLIIFCANILAAPIEDICKTVIVHFPTVDSMAKKLENMYNEQVIILSNLKSWPEFLMAIAIMAFFPALFEEVFFRGAMQDLLVRWWKKPLLAILVTSLVFSLIHSSIYLFVSRAALGFALGLMYHVSKNIWVNVIAHFLNNAIALAQLFYMSTAKQKIDPGKLDPKVSWWVAVIALAALYLLFRQLQKISRNNKAKIDMQERLIVVKDNSYDPFKTSENI
ncbi:MAG: CPBP family intramembrane glutamic endopeptidase [Ferruginibacter sp.]